LWIIIDNSVYDVSGYKDHPGGKEIFLPFAGKDASAAFSKFSHGQYALLEMQKYMLGPLVEADAKPSPFSSTSAHENTLSSLDPPSISLRSIWSRLALPLAIIAVVGAIKRVTGID
jgi:predicted heme/steroid binding protein